MICFIRSVFSLNNYNYNYICKFYKLVYNYYNNNNKLFIIRIPV